MDWAAIEADYRGDDLTVREICAKFGISQSALGKRATEDGWPRRRPRLPVGPERLAAAAKSEDDTVRMLARLTRALGRHVNEIERAARDIDRTELDREREAKALGALVQVLDRITVLTDRVAAARPDPKDTDAGHDRLVAALADRVARLGAAAGAAGIPPGTDES